MAESLLIKDIAIVTENEVIKNGYVGINDGKISTVSTERPKEPYSKEIQAPADSVLLPGMIDIHIHGAMERIRWMQAFPRSTSCRQDCPKKARRAF